MRPKHANKKYKKCKKFCVGNDLSLVKIKQIKTLWKIRIHKYNICCSCEQYRKKL